MTLVQLQIYSLLTKDGWATTENKDEVFTEDTPIGGPILLRSPEGETWVLHPDGRLTPRFCIIGQVHDLQDHVDGTTGKAFQTFTTEFFKLVTGKHYKEGQLGIVIPPDAILPDNILDDMWLRGRLAGKKRNRVAAKPMFGHASEAIFYGQEYIVGGRLVKSPAWKQGWKVGDNVTNEIGVVFREH